MSPKGKIVLGCLIGILSSATQSVGLTLQRKSHLQEELKIDGHRPPYKRPLWRIGFLLFITANLLGSSIQITTLPLIILSPLQGIGLVFNSICSSVILDEVFAISSLVGTLFVGVGAFFIAWFGSIDEPNHSLDELLKLMARHQFLHWLILSNTISLLIFLWIHLANYLHSENVTHVKDYWALKLKPLKMLSTMGYERLNFIKGLLYGVLSGTLSAHSLFLAKLVVELIINAITKSNYGNLKSVKCWLIIVTFFVLAITQLIFLYKGLKTLSTSVLYPLVFCIYNITNIINGLIFYGQFQVLTTFQCSMIIFGTLLVLLGVFALSWRFEDGLDKADYHNGSFISSLSERSTLLSAAATPFLGNTSFEDQNLTNASDSEYISFGSPKGEIPISIEQEDGYESDSGGTRAVSAISPFKYGSILDSNNNSGIIGSTKHQKRRSRRVLSYEQNKLLNQLKLMPDI